MEQQNEIIAKHQLYLESLERKGREANIVILGVPDEDEALDCAVTDDKRLPASADPYC